MLSMYNTKRMWWNQLKLRVADLISDQGMQCLYRLIWFSRYYNNKRWSAVLPAKCVWVRAHLVSQSIEERDVCVMWADTNGQQWDSRRDLAISPQVTTTREGNTMSYLCIRNWPLKITSTAQYLSNVEYEMCFDWFPQTTGYLLLLRYQGKKPKRLELSGNVMAVISLRWP